MRELTIDIDGDIIERQELLNGSETLTLEGRSLDGWTMSALVTWSRALQAREPEGDLTLAHNDGSELFATLTDATPSGGAEPSGDGLAVRLAYDVDGGAGPLAAATGSARIDLRLANERFSARATVSLGE